MVIVIILTFVSLFLSCLTSKPISENVKAVYSKVTAELYGYTVQDFWEKENPRGEGVLVYVPASQYLKPAKYYIWIVIDSQVFPLNGSSKDLTPSLPWPREASQNLWSKTGLSPLSASEAIRILY